jgi:hypothetical protein
MHQEVYADGIGEVTVSGTVVRIDLVSLSPTERDHNNSPKQAFRQRLIMPVEAFANSVELMDKVLQGLIDAGAIKRTPIPAAPEGEKQGRGDARLNGSPNFS